MLKWLGPWGGCVRTPLLGPPNWLGAGLAKPTASGYFGVVGLYWNDYVAGGGVGFGLGVAVGCRGADGRGWKL